MKVFRNLIFSDKHENGYIFYTTADNIYVYLDSLDEIRIISGYASSFEKLPGKRIGRMSSHLFECLNVCPNEKNIEIDCGCIIEFALVDAKIKLSINRTTKIEGAKCNHG